MRLTDEQYLQNEEFDCTYIIENDYFSIRSSGSIWSESRRVKQPIRKSELLALYKEVIALAKSVNCSISYKYKTKKNIMEHYEKALDEVLIANMIYDKMLVVANEIKERGLHYGCSDDIKLDEIHKLSHQYEKIFRDSSYMIISNIRHKLEELKKEFNHTGEERFCKIYL